MSHTREEKIEALGRVIDTLDILRVKCPWDAKQTNESLRANTIEETYELAQALLNDDAAEIRKELGDVLLHILFYSKIGDEKGQFDIADVADALNRKLIFRHPHVFGSVEVSDSHDVERPEQVWDKVAEERGEVDRAIADGDKDNIEAEFGDLLFSIVNAARLYGINPENALERTNRKFIRRFNHIEARVAEAGRKLSDMTLDEMNALWNEAKQPDCE